MYQKKIIKKQNFIKRKTLKHILNKKWPDELIKKKSHYHKYIKMI